MEILKVVPNNRKRAFEVKAKERHVLDFPYAVCDPRPTPEDRVQTLYIDDELGREGFTYILSSGQEGAILYDWVLYYNRDPSTMTDLVLYELTATALDVLEKSGLARREVIRRLGTSASQFYRLIDPTNHTKSMRQVVELLYVLGHDVRFEVVPRPRPAPVKD